MRRESITGAKLRPGTLEAIADLMEAMESEPVATGTETDWTREWESLDRLRSRPTTETLAAESVAYAELSAWTQWARHEDGYNKASTDAIADLEDAAALRQKDSAL
jgi:hypothetical protein